MLGIRDTASRLFSSLRRPAIAKPPVTVVARRTRPTDTAIPELAATIASALGKPEATPKIRPYSANASPPRPAGTSTKPPARTS